MYFQSFKHRDRELQFRLLKRLLKSETASREKMARMLGVPEQALMEALKGLPQRDSGKEEVKVGGEPAS